MLKCWNDMLKCHVMWSSSGSQCNSLEVRTKLHLKTARGLHRHLSAALGWFGPASATSCKIYNGNVPTWIKWHVDFAKRSWRNVCRIIFASNYKQLTFFLIWKAVFAHRPWMDAKGCESPQPRIPAAGATQARLKRWCSLGKTAFHGKNMETTWKKHGESGIYTYHCVGITVTFVSILILILWFNCCSGTLRYDQRCWHLQ